MQALGLGIAVFAAQAAELNCSSTGSLTPQSSAPPCAADQYEVLTDQAYGQGASHLFDLYKPRAATQPLGIGRMGYWRTDFQSLPEISAGFARA
jgi:hypothetical protein